MIADLVAPGHAEFDFDNVGPAVRWVPGEPLGGGAEMDSVLTDTESSTPVDRKWSLSTG